MEYNIKKVVLLMKIPTPYLSPLFRALKRCGVQVTVLYCIENTNDGIHYYDTRIKKVVSRGTNVLEGYDYKFLNRFPKSQSVNELFICNPDIKKQIKKIRPDALLIGTSYWSPTTWMAIQAAYNLNIPMVTRATVEAGRRRNILVQAVKQFLVTKYFQKMKAGVYECIEQKQYMNTYGMPDEKLFFSPCTCDNEYFENEKKKYNKWEIRQFYNIPKERLVILSTAFLESRKRHMDVIYAYEKLMKEGVELEIFFLGDGELKDELTKYVEDKHLDRIHLIGLVKQSEIAKFLCMADLFVLASQNDASPKALNEAMNFELPIVISDGIGTRNELLREGENGYCYPVGDIAALSKCIKLFYQQEKKVVEMGRVSGTIIKNMGADKAVDGWMKAFRYVT